MKTITVPVTVTAPDHFTEDEVADLLNTMLGWAEYEAEQSIDNDEFEDTENARKSKQCEFEVRAQPAPATVPPVADGLHEYTFDCALACAIRVKAADESAARDLLAGIDAETATLGNWPDGSPRECEVSLLLRGTIHVPPSVFQIDGEDME